MNTLLRTTIAGSLPKPAWLAEPEALWAPWKLEGAALDGRQARRGAARAARSGAGGHRHRVRRRADAPPFRHDVHRGARRRRLRAQEDGAHPQPLRRGRAGGRRRRSRAGTRFTSTMPRSCARRRPAPVKFTLPGPMTMVDTLYDAHYGSREKLALGVRRDPERGGAGDRGGRRRRDPVRRARIQRLLRRGARLGRRGARARRRGPRLHHRGAHLLRLRHQGQHRLEEDARQRMAAVRADVSPPGRLEDRPGVARVRAFARSDRPDRPARGQGRAGRAPSTSPPTASRRRRRWPTSSAPRCGSSPPHGLLPCTNCGMVPLSRDVARGKLRALGAGAALVRRELTS